MKGSTAVRFLLSLLVLQLISNASANWSLLGNFDPGRGNDQDRQASMDAWVGKQHSVQLLFTTWDQSETNWLWGQMVNIWNTGHVPIISWEPWFNQQNTPSNIEVLISQGQYDSYINSWGRSLANWLAGPDGKLNTGDDRRAFMRFAHEFNGNWYPWSAKTGESTPADYANMWRRVKTILGNLGCDSNHLQWIWSGICCEAGDFKMEQYFPGNDYIDWIGMGGMNFGTSVSWASWRQPQDLFPNMVSRMRTITGGTKPLGITEYTTVTDGGGVAGKNTWITNFFSYCQANNIRLTSYFNLDKDESGGMKDWAIFAGMRGDETFTRNGRTFNAYSGYRKAVATNSFFVGTDNNNPKWIRDEYFFGTGTCNANTDCLTGYTCSNGVCVTPGSNPSAPASVTPSTSVVPPSATPSKSTAPASATPTNTPPPASATPSKSAAPASATPSKTPAPASATPSNTPPPASATPSKSAAPASATPTNTPPPASATPSKSAAPASASSSKTPAPAASSSAPSKSPAPAQPTTVPTNSPAPNVCSSKKYMVYNCTVVPEVCHWGSNGSRFLINSADSSLDGSNDIQIFSSKWAGFGVFFENQGLNVKCFNRIKFSMRSTTTTKFELQDISGNKKALYLPGTGGRWKSRSVSLSYFSNVNFSNLNGLILITMEKVGNFAVTDVYYSV